MNLEFLMWRDIIISRQDEKGKPETIACGSLRFEPMKFSMASDAGAETFLHIRGYDGVQGCSNNHHRSYANPKLVKLTSQEIEFNADGWSGDKKYKVKITAKF